ncbi:MAG: LacI family DNA-binding transcriptional regulator [Saccharofermentanales bacterium]|jgi:LacI family repressor for deo operon, udp, cdd, tsx, nupC, and nupG
MNIRDVAKLAGVSTATVSRVIHGAPNVRPETREHVEGVIRRVGYVLPERDSSDRSRPSKVMLFLYSVADYNFYEQIPEGFESVLSPLGYTMLYCPLFGQKQRRAEQINVLCQCDVAGVVWAMRDFHAEEVAAFTDRGIPVVLARNYDEAPDTLPRCYTDFTESSFRMTEHLIHLGHRHIALMVEKVSFHFVASFCAGWKRAYFESELPYDEAWIVDVPNTVEGGYAKTSELLQGADPPDAFFCASNEMAFGALRAARDLYVPVPDRLSIVGFTDSPVAMLSEPELTTVCQPIQSLGTMLARMLLDVINAPDEDVHETREVVVQPQLCIRKSCG